MHRSQSAVGQVRTRPAHLFLRCRPEFISDLTEADMGAAIPATIPEEDSHELSLKAQAEQNEKTAADSYRSPRRPVKVGAAASEREWSVINLLFTIPAVRYVSDSVIPTHEYLKANNWLYLLAYVYFGCIGCVLYKWATFPVVNVQITRLLDGGLSWLLSRALDRLPILSAPLPPDFCLMDVLYKWLHPDADSRLPVRLAASVSLLWLNANLLLARSVLFVMYAYSYVAEVVFEFLNEVYSLRDATFISLPLVVFGKVVTFFWRWPYNAFYMIVLQPVLIQPTHLLSSLVRKMQYLLGIQLASDIDDSTLAENVVQQESPRKSATSPAKSAAAANVPAAASPTHPEQNKVAANGGLGAATKSPPTTPALETPKSGVMNGTKAATPGDVDSPHGVVERL